MIPQKNPLSRRDLISHAGASVAGAALATVIPTAQAQPSSGPTAAPFVDPKTKYPKPPYPGQSQAWLPRSRWRKNSLTAAQRCAV
jgi:hypothetical protein